MICLGVDSGQKRVGIALGHGSLAIPIESVDRDMAVERVAEIVDEKLAERIYVGNPISLSGQVTKSTENAVQLAKDISKAVAVPVFLLDERLTTKESARLLREAGLSARTNKSAIDTESARLLVEFAISSNHQCGELVGSDVG